LLEQKTDSKFLSPDIMQLPFTVKGTVVHGFGRGHSTLGFPTANVNPLSWKDDIDEKSFGVYCGSITIDNGITRIGILSIGKNVTFGVTHPTFEVHILNFNEDIYGKEVSVTISNFVRPMKVFTSINDLKNQIKKDISDSLRLTKIVQSSAETEKSVAF